MNRLARWQLSLKRKDKGFLFDGDDAVFKALLPQTTTYAEYGVGKSSLWVLANTPASIFAVDTSQYWIDQVRIRSSLRYRLGRSRAHWLGRSTKELCKACSLSALY